MPGKHIHSRPATPPYLRRRLWQFIGAITVISFSGPLAQWLIHGRVPIWGHMAASAIPAVCCGALSVFYAFWMRRQHTRAREAGGRVCRNCGYSLQGLPDDGTCPECGLPYTLAELRAQWWGEWSGQGRDAGAATAGMKNGPGDPPGPR